MTYLPTIIGVDLTEYWPHIYLGCVSVICLAGYGLMEILEAGDRHKRYMAREHLDRLRSEALPTEEAGTYHEPSGPAMHRLSDMKFRFMPCGHHVWEWSDLKQACLQCVLEGRVAAKDGGKQK